MKDKLQQIYWVLLDDALVDPEERFYKMSDKDLLTLISNIGEYFNPKQTRSLIRNDAGAPKELGF